MRRLIELLPKPVTRWRWVRIPDGGKVRDVRVNHDGESIIGIEFAGAYDIEAVQNRLIEVLTAKKEERQEYARRGAATRARRKANRVHETAKAMLAGEDLASPTCRICRGRLTDEATRKRGIGPECWQGVLAIVEGSR